MVSDSGFLYTPLPAAIARNITSQLNRAGASRLLPSNGTTREEIDKRVDDTYGEWMSDQYTEYIASKSSNSAQATFQASGKEQETRTMGYVTKDLCPGRGDDIDHVPGVFSVLDYGHS
jgi:hypothetical protein